MSANDETTQELIEAIANVVLAHTMNSTELDRAIGMPTTVSNLGAGSRPCWSHGFHRGHAPGKIARLSGSDTDPFCSAGHLSAVRQAFVTSAGMLRALASFPNNFRIGGRVLDPRSNALW